MATGRLQVGDLVIDRGTRTVSRNDEEVRLPRLSLRFLLTLADAAPNLVSSDELVDKVWDGGIATPETIVQRAMLVRQALGDDAQHPRYIESIRGEGYRCVATVRPLADDLPTAPDSTRVRRWQHPRVWLSAVALSLFGLGIVFWPAKDAQAPAESVAVLAFQDMSPTGDRAFLADGVAEELLNHIAQSTNLKVIARTSAFSFKGSDLPATEVAAELGVDVLIDGALRSDGERLRVSVQMIDGASGANLWSRQFDGLADDFFDLQERIAAAVVAELNRTPPIQNRLNDRRDPAAYILYLQARQLNHRNTLQDSLTAIPLLERALEIDPEFPLALAELARATYITGPEPSDRPGWALVWEDCIALIDRAYAIDPEQPFVLAWRAWIDILHRRDTESGFRELDRALSIDPRNDDAVRLAALLYLIVGQYDRTIELSEGLLVRDPFCVICHFTAAAAMAWSDQIEMAEDSLHYLVEVADGSRLRGALMMLGALYLVTDRAEQALQLFAGEGVPEPYATRGRLLALYELGHVEEFEREFLLHRQSWEASENPPFDVLASLYAWTGDKDTAFEWLYRGLDQHDDTIAPYLGAKGPFYRMLKNDPRWAAVQQRAGPVPAVDREPPK